MSSTTITNQAQIEPLFQQLEAVLGELVQEHKSLLGLAHAHRAAIADADPALMAQCLEKQVVIAGRVAHLDRQRQAIVQHLVQRFPVAAAQPRPGQIAPPLPPLTMLQLAARAPEALRSRLTQTAGLLREVLNHLHQEHQALKLAAQTLSSHMEGLMRQISRHVSHAGTYAPSGAMDSRVQVFSAIDVHS